MKDRIDKKYISIINKILKNNYFYKSKITIPYNLFKITIPCKYV